jgi:hypothetical protein
MPGWSAWFEGAPNSLVVYSEALLEGMLVLPTMVMGYASLACADCVPLAGYVRPAEERWPAHHAVSP